MDDPVRSVTEDEVCAFRENGWVLLPALVDPGVALEVRERALELRKEQTKDYDVFGTSRDVNVGELFGKIENMADHSRLCASIIDSRTGSRNASRLLWGDRPMRRIGGGAILIKEPTSTPEGHGPTHFHQDFNVYPFDRSWIINSWTALDELSPDMGTLQFYSGSHNFGLLGRGFVRPFGAAPSMLRDRTNKSIEADTERKPFHPWLDSLEVSEPPHMQPGDAFMWHGFTVHGAPANTSGRTRMALTLMRFDAETLYTGAPYHQTDGLGLTPNEPLDHPKFPLLPF